MRLHFLSPARRGRGILVAPGFCPTSRFLVGAKTTGQCFFKFPHHIPSSMGMCKWFFKDATKIKNGCQSSTLIFFVGAKTQKLKVGNYSNFKIAFPIIWRCAGDFVKVSMQFEMAAMDELHNFCGSKNSKNKVRNNSHITITTIWKCGVYFVEIWNGHHKSIF